MRFNRLRYIADIYIYIYLFIYLRTKYESSHVNVQRERERERETERGREGEREGGRDTVFHVHLLECSSLGRRSSPTGPRGTRRGRLLTIGALRCSSLAALSM